MSQSNEDELQLYGENDTLQSNLSEGEAKSKKNCSYKCFSELMQSSITLVGRILIIIFWILSLIYFLLLAIYFVINYLPHLSFVKDANQSLVELINQAEDALDNEVREHSMSSSQPGRPWKASFTNKFYPLVGEGRAIFLVIFYGASFILTLVYLIWRCILGCAKCCCKCCCKCLEGINWYFYIPIMFPIIPLLLVFIGFGFTRSPSYHILSNVKDRNSLVDLVFPDVEYIITDSQNQIKTLPPDIEFGLPEKSYLIEESGIGSTLDIVVKVINQIKIGFIVVFVLILVDWVAALVLVILKLFACSVLIGAK